MFFFNANNFQFPLLHIYRHQNRRGYNLYWEFKTHVNMHWLPHILVINSWLPLPHQSYNPKLELINNAHLPNFCSVEAFFTKTWAYYYFPNNYFLRVHFFTPYIICESVPSPLMSFLKNDLFIHMVSTIDVILTVYRLRIVSHLFMNFIIKRLSSLYIL